VNADFIHHDTMNRTESVEGTFELKNRYCFSHCFCLPSFLRRNRLACGITMRSEGPIILQI
jgi:hypothetical protein